MTLAWGVVAGPDGQSRLRRSLPERFELSSTRFEDPEGAATALAKVEASPSLWKEHEPESFQLVSVGDAGFQVQRTLGGRATYAPPASYPEARDLLASFMSLERTWQEDLASPKRAQTALHEDGTTLWPQRHDGRWHLGVHHGKTGLESASKGLSVSTFESYDDACRAAGEIRKQLVSGERFPRKGFNYDREWRPYRAREETVAPISASEWLSDLAERREKRLEELPSGKPPVFRTRPTGDGHQVEVIYPRFVARGPAHPTPAAARNRSKRLRQRLGPLSQKGAFRRLTGLGFTSFPHPARTRVVERDRAYFVEYDDRASLQVSKPYPGKGMAEELAIQVRRLLEERVEVPWESLGFGRVLNPRLFRLRPETDGSYRLIYQLPKELRVDPQSYESPEQARTARASFVRTIQEGRPLELSKWRREPPGLGARPPKQRRRATKLGSGVDRIPSGPRNLRIFPVDAETPPTLARVLPREGGFVLRQLSGARTVDTSYPSRETATAALHSLRDERSRYRVHLVTSSRWLVTEPLSSSEGVRAFNALQRLSIGERAPLPLAVMAPEGYSGFLEQELSWQLRTFDLTGKPFGVGPALRRLLSGRTVGQTGLSPEAVDLLARIGREEARRIALFRSDEPIREPELRHLAHVVSSCPPRRRLPTESYSSFLDLGDLASRVLSEAQESWIREQGARTDWTATPSRDLPEGPAANWRHLRETQAALPLELAIEVRLEASGGERLSPDLLSPTMARSRDPLVPRLAPLLFPGFPQTRQGLTVDLLARSRPRVRL